MTQGSISQSLADHAAGKPPGSDPQRASETPEQYYARMASLGLPPDINAGESIVQYAARLVAIAPAPVANTDFVRGDRIIGTVASASFASLVHSASIVTP